MEARTPPPVVETEQPPAADPPAAPEPAQPSLRRQFADWPKEGDDRPQPWDLDALGVPQADRELDPGAPNTVSPVVIRHQCPILTSGSAHPLVADLGRRLGLLGFENSVSQGANPLNVVDQTVLSAVERFRETYGVVEDPTPYGGTTRAAQDRAAGTIGPYTWEAIIRASDRAELAAEEAEAA